MSLQKMKNESDETRPDKLGGVLLIASLILFFSFILYGLVSFIVRGLSPVKGSLLPLILLSGIGVLIGWLRTRSGNPASRQFTKAGLLRVKDGALFGSAGSLLVLLIAQTSANHASWYNWFNGLIPGLILAIPSAMFIGVSAGGTSGLIIGKIWKNKYASRVGGALVGISITIAFILSFIRGILTSG